MGCVTSCPPWGRNEGSKKVSVLPRGPRFKSRTTHPSPVSLRARAQNSPVWRSSEEGCYFIKVEDKGAATFSELDPNSSVPFSSLHNGLEKCKQKVEVKFLQPPRLPGDLDLLPNCSHELRVSRLPSGAQQRWVAAATEAPALESHCPPPPPPPPPAQGCPCLYPE